MTKTVSLADDAYEALAAVKRADESFSELARRLARMAALDDLFDPEVCAPLTAGEAEDEKRRIWNERDLTREPRYGS